MNDDQHTYVEPTATALHERDHDRAEETPRESEVCQRKCTSSRR